LLKQHFLFAFLIYDCINQHINENNDTICLSKLIIIMMSTGIPHLEPHINLLDHGKKLAGNSRVYIDH